MPERYSIGGICRKGHPLTEITLYIKPSDNSKGCRVCRHNAWQKSYSNNKDRIRARQKEWCKHNKSKRSNVARKSHLFKKFGITPEDFDQKLLQQNGRCLICQGIPNNKPDSIGRTATGLDIDHDHETGKVRGLLCRKCNRGLGQFNDSVEILARAIEYLKYAKRTKR